VVAEKGSLSATSWEVKLRAGDKRVQMVCVGKWASCLRLRCLMEQGRTKRKQSRLLEPTAGVPIPLDFSLCEEAHLIEI
jgi:hypothetical protein